MMTAVSPLLSSNLAEQKTITHGFFTRQGGHSDGLYKSLNVSIFKEDNPDAPLKNRQEIASHFNAPLENLCLLKQVHGSKAHFINAPYAPFIPLEGDALVTTTPNLILGVQTADCVPILLSNASSPIIAAIHGGWRGLLAGIIKNTVALMQEHSTESLTLSAAIGPCISQESYEVSHEVYEAFSSKDQSFEQFFKKGKIEGKWFLDLPALTAFQLRAVSVLNIEIINQDTYSNEEQFFSCRRATHKGEPSFGNQATCIMIKEG